MDAEQAVTAAQVVIKEAKGTSLGQRHQPDREFGQFDRQRVQIDAVQTTLGNETARNNRAGFAVAGQRFLACSCFQNLTIHTHDFARCLD